MVKLQIWSTGGMDYTLIAITALTPGLLGQADLFANYLYWIGILAIVNKKLKKLNKKSKYKRTMYAIPPPPDLG